MKTNVRRAIIGIVVAIPVAVATYAIFFRPVAVASHRVGRG